MTESIGTFGLWAGFNIFVVLMLALDLFVFNREAHEIRMREAAIWSAIWVSMALAFNAGLYFYYGEDIALEFFAGWLIEKSLSVDNLFVFLLILGYFEVPRSDQHRVLFWGVFGAIFMRIGFILAGTALLARFKWMMYVFGGFLILTGIRMLFSGDDHKDPGESRVLKLVRRFFPMTEGYEGHHFFVKRDGKRFATPLFAVLVVIETSDVVFAVDSIPAIFGVTTDPFIVYSSNIFAILGLRALYFLLVGFLSMFKYLKYGLALVLSFVGVKMVAGAAHWFHMPIGYSLLIIAAILGVTMVASVMSTRRNDKPDQKEPEDG